MKKAFLGLTVVGILLFGACSDMGETVEEKKEPVEEVVEKEKVEVVEEVEEIKEEPVDNSALEQLMLTIMQDNFKGIADVTFNAENKAYIILPTDDGFTQELFGVINGALPKDSWNGLLESSKDMSNAIKEQVGPGYQVHMLNPTNPDNTILSLMDGIVFYDAVNQ